MGPAPPPWPEGVSVRWLDLTDSTSSVARAAALAGETGPVWIGASEQTAGRGRRGRAWVSPPGNFFASLLMPVTEGPAEAALRSFVAALALRDALLSCGVAGPRLTLKWPNDVLLDGSKLAGILLETVGQAGLIIGIGVNLAAAPPAEALEPGAVAPVSLAGATGLGIAPMAFLQHLAPAFAAREEEFRARGFAATRAAWLSHAARLGDVVRARLPDRVMEGRFVTLDTTGALVLETEGRRHLVTAADIQFG